MGRHFKNNLLLLSALVASVAGWTLAQESEQDAQARMQTSREAFYKKPVEELLKDLEQHPGQLTVVQRLRVLDDKSAIGPLQRAFDRVDGKLEKQSIAAALLSLGVKDGPYFEFLAGPAREAARSDVPFPLRIDGQGDSVQQRLSPVFVVWCTERGLDPSTTAHWATVELQMELASLVFARDPRASEIFLEALDAPNLSVVAPSIMGLAVLGQKETIEPLIRAVLRFPPSSRAVQSIPLLLFDDPRAQAFALGLVPEGITRSSVLEAYGQILPSAALPER